MKITSHIIEPDGDKPTERVGVAIQVEFEPEIQNEFTNPECVTITKPCPATLFQHPGNIITLATKRVLEMPNGKKAAVKAFRLRLAPVDSYSKKAFIQVYFPGKLHLGYIQKTEVAKVEAWLKELTTNAKEAIKVHMQNRTNRSVNVTPITIETCAQIQGVETLSNRASRLLSD